MCCQLTSLFSIYCSLLMASPSAWMKLGSPVGVVAPRSAAALVAVDFTGVVDEVGVTIWKVRDSDECDVARLIEPHLIQVIPLSASQCFRCCVAMALCGVLLLLSVSFCVFVRRRRRRRIRQQKLHRQKLRREQELWRG